MKRIFTIMGVALIACSLITSCKDDPEENNDDNNQQQQEQIADGVKIQFNGGEAWVPGDISTIEASNNGTNFIVADYFGTADSYVPGFELYTYQQEVGAQTSTCDDQGQLSSTSGPVICEYYEAAYLQNSQGTVYGDWWAKNVTCDMKAFDLTGMKATFTVDATMFHARQAFVSSYEGFTNGDINAAATASTNVTAGNVDLTTSSKGTYKAF
ncbi:MAG: hypothetical protein K6D59_00855 [Bacteroidales bacterium]|nr:hypothetical protein [Bacteroidales bacterium]